MLTVLGSRCLMMMRTGEAPIIWAACTYSDSRSCMSWPRIWRAVPHQEVMHMANSRPPTFWPTTIMMSRVMSREGNEVMTSITRIITLSTVPPK